ncbi:MAG: ribonuclease P protein component [Prevotella sp.]|nr:MULTISPECIES: ribonuclease P protein component [unclassified Prevotella]MCH3970649.1 ribonuclease P protein component [Prevotella sp.]MCH3984975.1 ribonuclease P protein component [Prevotella sp.]MCH3991548.1 ribonuclease P protein component [Prevotella sp.]MCH4018722.1 ribonuclease P protein component [Prevotella sp.]MCH4100125.1 ribonuclease P protein component [Prevotella sp.]
MPAGSLTFSKNERLCSKVLIDRLFSRSSSHSLSAFPLRAVYQIVERVPEEPQDKVLISVPKRCFKRAVKRNRVKRQIREAFRKNKYLLLHVLSACPEDQVVIAFLWQDPQLYETDEIEKKVVSLLRRISERI